MRQDAEVAIAPALVRNLVQSILDGTYDDELEDEHLNKILY